MELKARNKKLMLNCTYEERDFPKKLNGRWDSRYKCWSFSPSIMSFNMITQEAEAQGLELIVEKRVQYFFDSKLEKLNEYKFTHEFKTKPYQHQTSITSLILNKKKSFIFAGVGTGKSKGAIDAVSILFSQGKIIKVLVISPASIMWNFGNEIKMHSHFDYTIIFGTLDKRRKLMIDSTTTFDIINYEILDKMNQDIIDKGYDMVVFDEIHYCKSRGSTRSKAAYKISRDIPIRVGLTGTIISKSYEDLFMPYKIIDETVFGAQFTGFKNRYFTMGGYMQYEIIGYRNESEIRKLIASNSIKFDIRDVAKNLPDEQIIIKEVHLGKKTMKLYKELKTHMMIEHESGNIVASNILERMMRLSQISSGFLVNPEEDVTHDVGNEKLEVLRQILEGTDEKVAVFCWFTHSIDRVAALCEEMKLSYYIYDGRTKEKGLYEKFDKDDTRVWISQLQKSIGYSISSAPYCVFYELNHSRTNHVQAKGRILRIVGSDKHKCIFYIYLLAAKTIDEAVYKTLKDKDFTSKQALELVKGVE